MKQTIDKLKVNFVSVCPEGMNPEAHILLTKEAKEGEQMDLNLKTEGEQFQKSFLEFAKEITPHLKPNAIYSEDLQNMVVKCFDRYIRDVLNEHILEVQDLVKKDFHRQVDEEVKKQLGTQNNVEEEKVKVGDNIIEKEKVGEEAFSLFKSLSHQIEALQQEQKLSKCIKVLKEKYPYISGNEVVLGEMLLHLEKFPEPLQKEYARVFELANKYGESLMKESGTTVEVSKEVDDSVSLEKVREFQKEKGCTYQEAFLEVFKAQKGIE